MNRLARAILRAAELAEKTFNENRKCEDTSTYSTILQSACDIAAEEQGFNTRGTQPIYLLLKYSWNASLEWANQFIEEL